MQQVVIERFGDADVLVEQERDIPEPGHGEVVIKVAGAGLNPIDWKTRRGLGFAAEKLASHLPWVPGYDLSGVVVSVGLGESRFVPGDRVMGMIGFPLGGGACATHALVRADELIAVPEAVDLVDMGGVPLAALTAWQCLFEVGRVAPGAKVLIHAGAGGVGHFAVQFARLRDAHVIATASTHNLDFVDGLGAHEVIDYTHDDFVDACYGLDFVLDLVGGEVGRRSLHTLGEHGMLVTVPTASARAIIESAETLDLEATGMLVHPDLEHLEAILDLLVTGDVKVHVQQRFPLAQMPQAHRLLEQGHVRGKLVISPRD
ncbi:NADP-dependent oxidoreductase [Mangrovitalea sediminis]|uniref:NADP-dependent oxidoreductase n=1 Tax=Mangrovitalea sediminis TaxID=1982043 RepID=UPI000BE52B1D|nr:NADP-dependent oxidoreductase [Mangrovitalea sediminis]